MSQTVSNTTQVTLPTELVERLTREAKAMGLDLPVYLEFLTTAAKRKHDAAFVDAAKYTFSRYPEAMRKLAQ
jgi:hypothetical protein